MRLLSRATRCSVRRPGLTFLDLKTQWNKLDHLVSLFRASEVKIKVLVVQNLASDLSLRAFQLLEPIVQCVKYEHQLNSTLKMFVQLVHRARCEDKVTHIEANEVSFQHDWPYIIQILERKIFPNVKGVHLWMYSESIQDVFKLVKGPLKSPHAPKLKISTTLSLNPLVDEDMAMIQYLGKTRRQFSNVSVFYTLTVPNLDSLNDIWTQLDLPCISKLVLQNTCARFQWCYLKHNLNLLTNCQSLCLYVHGVSTDYLNKYIPLHVNKMTLIFKQFINTPQLKWKVPNHLTELNLFSRGSVCEMESLLHDMDWSDSNVRGLSLEYQYNTRMLDRNLHVTLPNTLEQLDVNFFSNSITLICDELPPLLDHGKLLCGSQINDVCLVDRQGKKANLVSSAKRMVAI